MREVRQPFRDLVVQAHLLLVDQHEQQRGHVRLGNGAVPEVHIGGGRNAGHGFTHGLADDLLPVDRHLDQHRPQMLSWAFHALDDLHHGVRHGRVSR
jgi:hypothetical protein